MDIKRVEILPRLGRVLSRHSRGWLLLVFLMATAATALLMSAPADLSGYWVLRIPTGDGNFRETFFQFRQEGEALSGSLIGSREIPLSEGSVQNGRVRFEVRTTVRQQVRTTTYEGTVEDGKIAFTVQGPGGNVQKGIAERTTREATLPPPRLPLPELRDLPDNGLARTPPMGWNSWNHFAGRIDDKTVREIADAMVATGMRDAGYIYVNIDDTWEGPRDANGRITSNLKFPNMKALADYVHSKGLKLGIYSSPGPKTCAGYEGSYGHEEQDARTFAEWGIDYLKYDWCSAARIYKDEEMQAVYQKMGEALQKVGRPIVYSLCQYGRAEVWKWGAKVGGNLWRTTGDIRDTWESMTGIGFRQIEMAPYAGPGHWNDPDMLEIGNGGMTADEYRTHMSLWSILAAPLLAGNDLRNMSKETLEILTNREVIAVDQDKLGKQGTRVAKEGDLEVWSKPLAGGDLAVGLFNRGEVPAKVTATWAALGITGPYKVRDLWAHADRGVFDQEYSATVPRHGVVMLRLSR